MTGQTLGQKVVGAVKQITVEPFLFLIMFGLSARLLSFQSLLHDRACRISLNFSHDICDNLDEEGNGIHQEEAIEYGNNLYNYVIMISTIPALVMATFLGPWSDRYSRKYPLIFSTLGILIDSIFQAIITHFKDASPNWFLVSATITGLSGGLLIVLSSTYSYLSDITNERSRQTRFAVLEFFTILSTPIGSLTGGHITKTYGYLPAMAVSSCSFALASLWLTLYVKETKPRATDVTLRQMIQDLFRVDNVKQSFHTCAKPRAGNLRLQIWLLLLVGFSIRFVHMGSLVVGFPYAKKVFKWDVAQYSYTTAGFNFLNGLAALVLVPFLGRKLMVHEAALGLIGILSLMMKMVVLSVAQHDDAFILYAWFGGTLFSCGGIAVRSRISKLVSKQELGKVFSLLATCESLTPVLGTVIMTQIFHASFKFYPGLAFAFAAISLIPAAFIFWWMMGMPTMSFTQYRESEEAKRMKELEDVTAAKF